MRYWIIMLLIAMVACKEQDTDQDVTILRDIVPITTDSSRAKYHFIRARYLLQNGFTGEVLNVHFKGAIQEDTTFARVYNYLSVYGPTDSLKRQAHELSKKFTKGISKAEKMLIEASEYRFQNPDDTLEEMLFKVAELHPEDNYLYQTIAYLLMDKNPPRAIRAAKRSVELDTSYAGGYMMLGNAYMKNKQYDKAEEMFDKYIELLGAYGIPFYTKSELYVELGRYAEAIELMERAYELNPTLTWIPDRIIQVTAMIDSLEQAQ